MPLLQLTTPIEMDDAMIRRLSDDLCRETHACTGKPVEYIMVSIHTGTVRLGDAPEPAAWIDYRGIGALDAEALGNLIRGLGDVVERHTGIPPARLYLVATAVPAAHWGWNGKTFG